MAEPLDSNLTRHSDETATPLPPNPSGNACRGRLCGGRFTYVGDAVDGATLLNEENLPEVVCAKLGAPDPEDRGIGKMR